MELFRKRWETYPENSVFVYDNHVTAVSFIFVINDSMKDNCKSDLLLMVCLYPGKLHATPLAPFNLSFSHLLAFNDTELK